MDDVVELAAAMLETPYESVEDEQAIEEQLIKEYEVDFEALERLTNRLIRFTPVIRTAITDTPVHAFGRPTENGKAWVAIMQADAKVSKIGE